MDDSQQSTRFCCYSNRKLLVHRPYNCAPYLISILNSGSPFRSVFPASLSSLVPRYLFPSTSTPQLSPNIQSRRLVTAIKSIFPVDIRFFVVSTEEIPVISIFPIGYSSKYHFEILAHKASLFVPRSIENYSSFTRIIKREDDLVNQATNARA